MVGDYRSLIVYQKAEQLAELIYSISRGFPKDEMFGLTSQMRRSAISVVANIVEGWSRNTNKDKKHFYYISRGSLTELEFYIDFCKKLKYISDEQHQKSFSLKADTGRLLMGLIKSCN